MTGKAVYDEKKGCYVYAPVGDIDAFSSRDLKKALAVCYSDQAGAHDLRLDFSGVTYIDSTGLGVLIGLLKKLKLNDKKLYISGSVENVKKIFTITGLDKIFVLED